MGFIDEVDAEKRTGGRKPALYATLRQLPPDLRGEVIAAIDDHTLSAGAIARALRKRGVSMHEAQIQKHRRTGREWPSDLR